MLERSQNQFKNIFFAQPKKCGSEGVKHQLLQLLTVKCCLHIYQFITIIKQDNIIRRSTQCFSKVIKASYLNSTRHGEQDTPLTNTAACLL